MKKFILLVTTFALISAGFQSFFAQKFKCNKFRENRLIDEMKLSEDQIKKFNSIRFQQKEREIELEAQLKKNQLSIQKLLEQEDFQKEKLLNLIEKGNDVRGEINKSKINFWLSVRDILDDNQKDIWKKHFRKTGVMQERMREFRGRRFMRERFNNRFDDEAPRMRRGLKNSE